MAKPKSSWGGIIAAGSSTASVLHIRKTKQHTKQILDLVSSDHFVRERMHKEQLLTTILASERTSEIFVEKLNELNQNLSVSINTLGEEMRDISKLNWSILNHLETRKAEREYEGKMFHLVTTVMEDLENLGLISSEFPEYALVKANAWNELFVSLKFGLEKFAQMEDSRKYDRARKVFNELENLIQSLSESTKKKHVKALDNSLASHQRSINQVAILKTKIKSEKSRLSNANKKLKQHKNKRPRPPNLTNKEARYQSDIDKRFQRVEECKDKLVHFREIPNDINEHISESNRLLATKRTLHNKMRYQRKSRPWFSWSKKELWQAEADQILNEYEQNKSQINSIQDGIQKLCSDHKIDYNRNTNTVSISPYRKGMITRWKRKLKSAEEDLGLIQTLPIKQKKRNEELLFEYENAREEHREISSELKKQVIEFERNIGDLNFDINATEKEGKDALLESAHLLPSAYLAID